MKSFILEVIEIDPKKPHKPRFIGKTQFLMKDALKKGNTGRMSLFLLDEKNRYQGKIEITQCSARRHYSFFDLQLKCQLNIVPILAVDFSIGNIVMGENGLPGCLHSRKKDVSNDYISAMTAISKSYSQYAKFMLAYGIGARTQKGNGGAVEICSMTGDFVDPYIENQDELLNCYEGTLQSIAIAGPVNYKGIVKFVCDLAQLDFGTAADPTNIRNYYVLTILMTGIIDDIDESVNEILRAAELPISVQIVKLGDVSESDNDFGTLIERTRDSFKKCERNFIDMHDMNTYKQHDSASGSTLIREEKFQLDLMRNVPSQIEQFFENQHFDFDNSNAFLNSPEATNLSSSDSSSQHNYVSDQIGAALLSPQNNNGPKAAAATSPDKASDSKLTADNLAKRDSLMLLDDDARQNLQQEIDAEKKIFEQEDQQSLMQAARLKQVNLEIEDTSAVTPDEESKDQSAAGTQSKATPPPAVITMNGPAQEIDYRAKINMFIEMEKLKLLQQAVNSGISEADCQEVIEEESLIDFDLEHFKEIVKDRQK